MRGDVGYIVSSEAHAAGSLCKKSVYCVHNGGFTCAVSTDKRYDLSNPNRLCPILDIDKDLTVIGAHFGGWSIWEEAAPLLKHYPNFYVDTSSSLYAISPRVGRDLVRQYGAHRVLFATDYPMWDPSQELKRFRALELSPGEEEQILWKNAARLFSISL